MYVCTRMCVCRYYVFTLCSSYLLIFIHTHTHTYIHTYVRTYIHAYYSMEHSPSWEANRFSERNSPHFMQPEGSLSHSQVPANCPYPEPAGSSPYSHISLPEDPFKYYTPICTWFSQAVSFPQVSSLKHCIRLSSTHTNYTPRPSNSFIFHHPKNIGWG
jgi:hypothetical protein